jgi:hypothetical protein
MARSFPMTRISQRSVVATTAAAALAATSIANAQPRIAVPLPRYDRVVAEVAAMVSDTQANELVRAKGLQLVNVMWEDAGRWQGSSVGPNISDVTIEVETSPGGEKHLMPVIRHDNFSDKTGDVRLDKIWLPVGNHAAGALQTVSLREVLARPARYLSLPRAGKVTGGSLLAERDTHALVSAQHAFLPVPKSGRATFWPVIFNYQSTARNPAVLTILVTRQGTSMTIVDNARDTVTGGNSWGQRLYFNKDGAKAPLIAERLTDVKSKGSTANGEDAASLGADANLLMLIQVPLKYRAAPRRQQADDASDALSEEAAPAAGAAPMKMARRERSDVDVAVLGHGKTEGPYTELDGLTIERDPRFPVRVTVQFYQATSNGVVSSADVERMAAQVNKVYGSADYVGSLVVPGPRDRARPTNFTPGRRDAEDPYPGLTERRTRFGWWSVPIPARRAAGIASDD